MVLQVYTQRAREAADLLIAWDRAHQSRQPARAVRRARLAYYDARFAFEGLAGAAVARQLIERALVAEVAS